MTETPLERAKHLAPWRGRPRVADAKGCFIAIRCTVKQHTAIKEGAARAGLSIGAYLRALALGHPGPRSVRRPLPGDTELARLLGHIGKIGSNVNQIAKIANTYRRPPSKSALSVMRRDIGRMRNAVLKALRRGD
jgi:Bacterial mobilisation protein (MobC)